MQPGWSLSTIEKPVAAGLTAAKLFFVRFSTKQLKGQLFLPPLWK